MSVFKQQAGRRNAIGRKVFMAIAATSMMSAMCVSPVYAAPGDDHDRAGQRYGHDQRDDRHDRDHGRRDDHRYDRRDYGIPITTRSLSTFRHRYMSSRSSRSASISSCRSISGDRSKAGRRRRGGLLLIALDASLISTHAFAFKPAFRHPRAGKGSGLIDGRLVKPTSCRVQLSGRIIPSISASTSRHTHVHTSSHSKAFSISRLQREVTLFPGSAWPFCFANPANDLLPHARSQTGMLDVHQVKF